MPNSLNRKFLDYTLHIEYRRDSQSFNHQLPPPSSPQTEFQNPWNFGKIEYTDVSNKVEVLQSYFEDWYDEINNITVQLLVKL